MLIHATVRDQAWPSIRIGILVFLLAFSVRLGIMLTTKPYNEPLRVEIHHLAYSIVNGQGYANPYPTPTGPTAIYSPGCPLILAGIYRLFGTGTLAEAVTYIVDIAVASSVFALLPLLSMLLGLPRPAGIAAAIAGASLPVYLLNEYRSTTAVLTALCLTVLTLLTLLVCNRQLYPRLGLVCGSAWGCALLFAPNLLLIGLLWLGTVIVRLRVKALGFTAATLIVVCVFLAPWAIRNQLVLGSPIFSRSNFGLELWIANNDVAAASYGDNSASHNLYQPFVNSFEANRLRTLGEVAYMRQKLNAAKTWIGQHPRRFLQLTADRVVHFWFPVSFRPIQTIVLRSLTIAAIAGLVFAWFRQRRAFWILGSIWLAFPLVYYLVQLDNPYRYPIYWSVLLLAVYGSACCFDVVRKYMPALARFAARPRPTAVSGA